MRSRDWMRCKNPEKMIEALWSLPDSLNKRRLRIFTLTAVKPALERVNNSACRAATEVAWQQVEGTATPEDIATCNQLLQSDYNEAITRDLDGLVRLLHVIGLVLKDPGPAALALLTIPGVFSPFPDVELLTPVEKIACCKLLREIFGDTNLSHQFPPFWQSEWQTSTVHDLATGIYNELAFDRLPILADALQDAGCDSEEILNHCRRPGRHIRGCWVVDLSAGKS